MKKILVFSVLAIGIIFLSGCANKGTENANQQQTMQNEEGGIINSIKDAIGLGKKMQCTYTYKEGDESFTTTAYIEGKKYKGESEVMGKKQLAVFDGETMYSWSEEDKKGTKWTKSCMDELETNTEDSDSSTIEDPTDVSETFEDAMDVKCTPVSSIDFSIPSDIEFSDMCEQMKTMQKRFGNMKNNMPGNMPQGMPAGSIPQMPDGVPTL